MSQQIGLIKIKGNLDGVSFYQTADGGNFVRMAKGPSKQRIQTDPAFKRTRENNREFAGSTQAARALRRALVPVMKIGDRKLTSRTVKLCKAINLKGKGPRGQRTIDISANREMLTKLELNQNRNFLKTFKQEVVATHTADRNSAQISIAAFSVDQMVTSFPGATHFRIVHLIGVVSDYAFNPKTSVYDPIESKSEGKYNAVFSDYISLEGDVPAINLPVALPNAPVLTPTVSVIQGVGIVFYQSVDDTFVSLKQADSFRIIEVF